MLVPWIFPIGFSVGQDSLSNVAPSQELQGVLDISVKSAGLWVV